MKPKDPERIALIVNNQNHFDDNQRDVDPEPDSKSQRETKRRRRGQIHAYDSANWCSRILFIFSCPIMRFGYHKVWEIEDLSACDSPTDTHINDEYAVYDNLASNERHSMWRLLWRLNRKLWSIASAFYILHAVFRIINIFVFAKLMDIILHISTLTHTDSKSSMFSPVSFCILFAVLEQLIAFSYHNHWLHAELTALKTRNVITNLLLQKLMKVSLLNNCNNDGQEAAGSMTTGELLNGISTDCDRLYLLVLSCVRFVCAVVVVLVSIPIFLMLIGAELLFGYVAIVVILLLLTLVFAQKQKVFMKQAVAFSDQRVKMLHEMLSAIRIVKMYAWEMPLIQRILQFRSSELKYYKLAVFVQAVSKSINLRIMKPLVILIIFSCKVFLFHQNITFTDFYIVNQVLQLVEILFLDVVRNAGSMINGMISVHRVEKIFALPEVRDIHQVYTLKHDNNMDDERRRLIQIKNMDFYHTNISHTMLRNINMSIHEKEHIAIIGNIGSGKSSLLLSLLGEKHADLDPNKSDAEMVVYDEHIVFDYVGHDYFIMNATVRSNIIINSEYDEALYDSVIDACALKHDMMIFPAGDMTEIGDKGINISGGQKARICLARIVYKYLIVSNKTKRTKFVILLDDPLSAVDNDVAHHIFVSAIKNLCKEATLIIALNSQLQSLHEFDRVVVMKHDKDSNHCYIADSYMMNQQNLSILNTKYEALLSSQPDRQVPVIHGDNELELEQKHEAQDREAAVEDEDDEQDENHALIDHHMHQHDDIDDDSNGKLNMLNIQQQKKQKLGDELFRKTAKLVSIEDRQRGRVKNSSLIAYINGWTGVLLLFALFATFMTLESAFVAFDYFINLWTSDSSQLVASISTNMFLKLLLVFIGVMLIFDIIRSVFLIVSMFKATQIFTQRSLFNVLFSNISYFDSTRIGRIMNRLTNDFKVVDLALPNNALFFAPIFSQCLAAAFVVLYNMPFIMLYMLLCIPCFIWIAKVYLANSRELRRLDAITKSPIFNIYNEVCHGLITVRSMKLENYFTENLVEHLRLNSCVRVNLITAQRWNNVMIEIISAVQVILVCVSAIYLTRYAYLSPFIAVLCITYQQKMRYLTVASLKLLCEIEVDLAAVERLYHFFQIDTELKDYHHDQQSNDNSKQLAFRGDISFNHLTFRYRDDLPCVLDNVSFDVKSAESVGICGRTGSGKSSLMRCLLRMFKVKNGQIFIDNVDINKMSLFRLRSNISIIPQTPTVFTGNVRFNLDPFQKYSDEKLRRALKLCYLHPKYDLDFEIQENGNNLSQGEKQLLCIARCIVRDTKILLCDEATSNIDMEYDQLIQKVIQENFKNCTVLTIAHRLSTIIGNDKILVLHDGEMKQFDSPQKLLNNPRGQFYTLYHQSPSKPADHKLHLPQQSDVDGQLQQKDYLVNFYKQQNEPSQIVKASSFARFVIERQCIRPSDIVMEWGCGNGRDCNYLSNHCQKIIAVDIAESPHATNFRNDNIECWFNTDFTELSAVNGDTRIDVVYSRFSLDSVRKAAACKALEWANRNLRKGGMMLIEARSIKDPLYGKGVRVEYEEHAFIAASGADDTPRFRRFIDLNELTQELERNNFRVTYTADANNLSVYKHDNPYLVRVIAQKM